MTKEQQVWAHEEGTPPHSLADYGSKEKASGSALVKPAFEGHQVELERNFSMLSALGLAFALLNSWTAMSASLSVVLPSGGSISMLWGLLTSAFGAMVMALSLAEITHNLPMSGGQYDWTYIMAPAGYKNGLSFFTGWMANAGWIALVATASSLGANFVYGVAYLWKEFEPKAYQNFLLYLAFTLWATLLNVFGIHLLPIVDSTAGLWSLIGIVVVIITLLACSSGHYQPAKDVFARWTNTTGWPDGMAFILGLLQSTFGLTGFDAVTHMIEEMPRPSKNAPKVMVTAVILGSTTSFVFMVVILFCLRDWDEVLTSATGPLLQVYYQATNSKIGGTCLIVFNIGSMLFAAQGLTTVASRMLLSFVRDRGLGKLSRPLEPVHPKLKVPVWCILFVSGWVACFGLIELGSSVALNAILSASLVFLQISYFVPILLLLIRGDRAFNNYNNDAVWSLGKWRRPINAMALIFIAVTTVVFLFPPFIPVTSASQMNFVVVVFGIVMVMCLATWLIDGRKHFNGPSDLNMRLAMGKEA